MADEILLNSMKEAPKDGTKIVIIWLTPSDDDTDYDIREAWWWKPTELHQWESGARPHWKYIRDDGFTFKISDPLGWIVKPTLKLTKVDMCIGPNCSTIKGVGHSLECEEKHDSMYIDIK